jgi:hypothetical protein
VLGLHALETRLVAIEGKMDAAKETMDVAAAKMDVAAARMDAATAPRPTLWTLFSGWLIEEIISYLNSW